MKNTMKIITRNEVQKLNSNDVIGYILSDGEFIINEPNVVQETSQSADKRFCYGDFDEFVFDHDLGNLEYIIIKDESKVSGSSTLEVAGKLTDEQEQPQSTVKNIIEDLKELTSRPYAYVGNDVDSLGDLISDQLEDLYEALGIKVENNDTTASTETPTVEKLLLHAKKLIFERKQSVDDMADALSIDLGIIAEMLGIEDDSLSTKYFDHATTIKKELQDIYSLNDSMITGDPNHVPTYDDGTPIRPQDLADMNMQTLDLIAELLGFELEEGATPVKTKDQETYDNLPAEDKLNVDMLNKLHEVQDHILRSNQTAVGANRITKAVTLLEAGLGVIDHEEE